MSSSLHILPFPITSLRQVPITSICIPSSAWQSNAHSTSSAAEATTSSPPPSGYSGYSGYSGRLLLEPWSSGGHRRGLMSASFECPEGKAPVFTESEVIQAHLLLFALAVVHIVYTTTSLFSCLGWVRVFAFPRYPPPLPSPSDQMHRCCAFSFPHSPFPLPSPSMQMHNRWSKWEREARDGYFKRIPEDRIWRLLGSSSIAHSLW